MPATPRIRELLAALEDARADRRQSATDLDRQIREASDEEIEAMVAQSKLEGQP